MKTVELVIDGKNVMAERGEKILWAALENGIYIPHLCSSREMEFSPGSCRLCFVEVVGYSDPVTACTETVRQGMVVQTRSEQVDRLVASAFELLMSVHRLDCRVCPANKKCGLQEVARARKLSLRPRRLRKIEPDWPLDDSRADFGLNPNHCILCGKCVEMCRRMGQKGILDFTRRSLGTVIGTFDRAPLAEQRCEGCLKCVIVCPVGALYLKPGV